MILERAIVEILNVAHPGSGFAPQFHSDILRVSDRAEEYRPFSLHKSVG